MFGEMKGSSALRYGYDNRQKGQHVHRSGRVARKPACRTHVNSETRINASVCLIARADTAHYELA